MEVEAACAARPQQRCLDADTALAFADGELTVAERVAVEQCIDGCARCRSIVAEAARSRGTAATSEILLLDQIKQPASKPASPANAALAPGEQVGRYVVERSIGAGGMGYVSLARDPELRRQVVIKLVRADVWGDESRDELEARLMREAQAMAQLSHPNVVQIFDIGRHGERVFLAMEYVPGQTLDGWLQERERSADEVLAMMRQCGAGLAAAHKAGLVHRDFKPANVLVDAEGVAKVTDFGLARGKIPGAAATRRMKTPSVEIEPEAPPPKPSSLHAVLTAANAVIGTPAYMAPEQAEGLDVDARSDQFAFALVLLDSLVHQSPVRRNVSAHTPHAIEDALHVIPPRMRTAIARALSGDPDARFATMAELLEELRPPRPRPKRSKWLPIVAGLAACGGAAALYFAWPRGGGGNTTSCTTDVARAWPREARDQLVASFAASPRPFDAWTGASLAAELDRAAERLGTAELAKCQGTPIVDDACLARRRTALTAAARLRGDSDPIEARALVASIDSCESVRPSPQVAKIRAGLAGKLDAKRAQALGDAALALGELGLAADAYERGGALALAAGDLAGAETQLLAALGAGERAGDDAARGRALLLLLDLARDKGDYETANRDGNALRAIASRREPDARSELAISLREAETFGVVGDADRADAAWARVLEQARALASPDDELRALAGQAWARYTLHFDRTRARSEIAAALASVPRASRLARAHALTVQGDLALIVGDGEAAKIAFTEAARRDPDRARDILDRVRMLRARGFENPKGVLEELKHLTGDDITQQRIALARGQIQQAAGMAEDASYTLLFVNSQLLPVAERLELLLARCSADIDRGKAITCDPSVVVKTFHPKAPARAHAGLIRMRALRLHDSVLGARAEIENTLEILIANNAPLVQIAEVHFELARALDKNDRSRSEHAKKAREIYETAGRTEQVAEIDRWIAGGTEDAMPPEESSDDAGPRRGPQP